MAGRAGQAGRQEYPARPVSQKQLSLAVQALRALRFFVGKKSGSSGFRVLRCLWGALPPNPRHLSHWANSMVEAFGLPLADGQCCR